VTGEPVGLELGIVHANVRSTGGVVGTIQVHNNGFLIYEREGPLSDPGVIEKIADTLTGFGIAGAGARLYALIKDARETLTEDTTHDYRKPESSRHSGPAKFVVDQLAEGGRFLASPFGSFYFNGTTKEPVQIDSMEMLFVLRGRFDINPKQQVAPYIVEELRYKVHSEGERVVLHRFSYYEAEKNTLYVDEGAGRMLRVTADAVQEIDNGEDGVLFVPTQFQEPWKYERTDPKQWRLRQEIVEAISFVEGEDSPLSPAEQGFLFLLWLTGLFFRTEMPTRPIAVFVGDTGSGKSVAVRIVGRILFGPDFELDQLVGDKEDDFYTAATNRPFVGYDNLDTRIKWLEDALATCATGIQRSKRKLYTDNEEVRYKPDTFLALAARTPRFRRSDVANRLLLFQLASRRSQNRPNKQEKVLYDQIAQARAAYLSELVDRCRQVLAVPRQSPEDSPIRKADFYAVAHRVALSMNLADEADTIMEKLRGVQHDFAAEENTLVLCLFAWVEQTTAGELNPNRRVKAGKLFGELKAIADASSYRWDIESPVAMGRQLHELKEGLADRLSIDPRRGGRVGSTYRIQPAGWAEDARLL